MPVETNQLGMSVKPSALFALASSGQAVSEQKPISERAAKPVKFPVKLLCRHSVAILLLLIG
jgi:hypothetical protein